MSEFLRGSTNNNHITITYNIIIETSRAETSKINDFWIFEPRGTRIYGIVCAK